MLRPRESRDLRLVSSDVMVTPDATITWAQDVFGNSVATATFQGMADNLVIDSVVELQLNAAAWPVFDIAASAIVYPFQYSSDEFIGLGALAIRQYPDPSGRLRDGARTFVLGHSTDTLSLLKDLCAGVKLDPQIAALIRAYSLSSVAGACGSDGWPVSLLNAPPLKRGRAVSYALGTLPPYK